MSEKITDRHRARKAMLYIRQSTTQQVAHNQESRRLQYAMQDRLKHLGWCDVEVVDEDLGKSAAGTMERSGFQRLVAEVSLGNVGVVGARELSRFARNSRDWQRLMEVCRYVDTLVVDHEAVYNVRLANDRLLLGLKGNLNEYELDLLRLRAQEAKLEKAKRGEYYAKIAVGYRKTPDGELEKNPDARVQHAVHLIFDKFLELGSARQVLLWMREHQIEVPINRNDRGDVIWKPASYSRLHMVLSNPIYAGAYVYGRTRGIATMADDGSFVKKVTRVSTDDAIVLLHDHHDGYIERDTFERIQNMITRNSQSTRRPGPGAARLGQALLAGLLRCRRCGERLLVNYGGSAVRVHRYECSRANTDHGEARCISFSGLDVDDRIVELVLRVVQPAALEATQLLANEETVQRDQLLETLTLELRAASYAAERAQRQFDAADPENRLVVDELERRWNAALERMHEIERRFEEARASAVPLDTARFASLGTDLAHVWHDPSTDVRLKKRIIRTLIEEIVADTSDRDVALVVHWKGGVHTELSIKRRRRGQNRAQTSPDLVEAVRVLARVCSDERIALALNASDMKTARGDVWTREIVRSLRSDHQIAVHSSASEAWLTLSRAAKLAGVADRTLARAIERGVVSALRPVSRGPWVINAQELMHPDVLGRITKKPRARPDTPTVPTSTQLELTIPRM